ncbi:MAG: EamA family transporter [Desulfuromonadales bacterium]|nr:EamA family transporter [Desulfuromonadales bacterium]
MSYLYVALTIFFTVYGQLVIKWQVAKYGALPELFSAKLLFLLKMMLNPWIVSGFFAAFFAALCWMAAMTKLDLSHAYPIVSLTFVIVILAGSFMFNEPLTWPKVVGMLLIMSGVIVGSQG